MYDPLDGKGQHAKAQNGKSQLPQAPLCHFQFRSMAQCLLQEVTADSHEQRHVKGVDKFKYGVTEVCSLLEILRPITILDGMPHEHQQDSNSFDKINIIISFHIQSNYYNLKSYPHPSVWNPTNTVGNPGDRVADKE